MLPKVSIIIPIYNAQPYLSRCLASVEAQTYENIETIIVDDGSTDASYEIALKFVQKRPCCASIYRQKNAGPGIARNLGVSKATGEYIAFIDSDDWVDPTFVEKMQSQIAQTNEEIAICDVMRVTNGQKTLMKTLDHANGDRIYSHDLFLQGMNQIYVWNKLYKRSIWDRYRFSSGFFEDIALVPVIISEHKELAYVQEPLYYYNKIPTSISADTGGTKFGDAIHSYEDVLEHCLAANKPELAYFIVKRIISNMKTRDIYKKELAAVLHKYYHGLLIESYLTPEERSAIDDAFSLAK